MASNNRARTHLIGMPVQKAGHAMLRPSLTGDMLDDCPILVSPPSPSVISPAIAPSNPQRVETRSFVYSPAHPKRYLTRPARASKTLPGRAPSRGLFQELSVNDRGYGKDQDSDHDKQPSHERDRPLEDVALRTSVDER